MGKAIILNRFQNFCIGQILKALELKKQNEKIKKLKVLYSATYNHYLKIYLQKNKETGRVDLPDFFYTFGFVICSEALENANIAMDRAVARGEHHINKCYKELTKGGRRGR